MKKIFFLLSIFLLTGCQSQEQKESKFQNKSTTTIEKFDFEIYNKTNHGSDEYTLSSGNHIYAMGFLKNKGGFLYERLSSPSFLTVYKEFYANGNLKKKETYIGENVKVSISRYYDEQGNLIKEVNEDLKFGKIKPQQVLEFLQGKGYINLKTGEGQIDEDGRPVFKLNFGEQNNEKYWIITIVKGIPNTDPKNFPEIGEPPAFLPLHYVMDGQTGEVKIDGAEDKKLSVFIKPIKGKTKH